jgi:hypothetical protein
MGRFAKKSERDRANFNQVMTARPQSVSRAPFKLRGRDERDKPGPRAPSETKYFLLSVAALIGLGLGWLLGEAINGWSSPASSPPAVTDQTLAATSAEAASDSVTAPPAVDAPVVNPETEEPTTPDTNVVALPGAGAAVATVAETTPNDTQMREGHRSVRRSYRRNARGNVFIRPFKALRRLKVW